MNPIPPVEDFEPIDPPAPTAPLTPPAPPELRIVPPPAEEVTAAEGPPPAESPPAPAEAAPSSDHNPLLEALAQGPLVMDVPRTASEAFHFLSVRAAEKVIEEAKREGGAAAAQMWGNISETYKGLSAFSAQLPQAKARHLKWSYLVILEAIPDSAVELGQLLRWLEKVPACADDKAVPAAFLWFHLGQCSFIHGQSLPRPQRTAQGWTCEHNGLTRVLSNEESYGLQQQRHFWSQRYYDRCMQTAGILLRKLSGIDVKFDPNKNPLEVVCMKCKATVRAGSSHDCPAESAVPTDGVPPMRAFTRPEAPAEPSPAAFDDAPAAEAAADPAAPANPTEGTPVESPSEAARKRVEELRQERDEARGQDSYDHIDELFENAQEELNELLAEAEDSGETAAAAPAGDGTAAATEAPSPVEAIEAAFATAIVPADPDVPTMIGNKVPAPAAVPSGTDEEPTAFATAPRED